MKTPPPARKKAKRPPRGAITRLEKKHARLVADLLAASPSSLGAAIEAAFDRRPEALDLLLALPARRAQVLARMAMLEKLDLRVAAARALYEAGPRDRAARERIAALLNGPDYVKRFGPMTEGQIKHAIYDGKPAATPLPEELLDFLLKRRS